MSCSFTSPVVSGDGLLGPSLVAGCNASQFFVFMTLVDTLARAREKISGTSERVESVETPDDVYDFIVVGGAVVAARLSEIHEWKVLLLEAGPDEPVGAQIPSFAGVYTGTNLDWNYKTTNESYACLSTEGSCSWPQGKNIGGNTVHNHMVYLRGNPTDYNNWADQGNEGWRWADVKPFFLEAENNAEIERVGRKHHSTGGPLPVEKFPYFPEFGHTVLAAAEELGYGVSDDLNGDVLTGFSITQAASRKGVRCSSSRAYLWPIRNRKNLHISLNSLVTKVIVKNKRAVGVEYHKNGKLRRVSATKEVVLSAGTMRSPHILLLSGIGPKEHLESVNVDVVKNLPGVGENLHDHVSIGITFTVNVTDTYDNDWAAASEYLAYQTGPMSGTALPQMVAMLASDETAPDYPDIEIFFVGYDAECAPGNIGALRSPGRRTIGFVPTYLHPKSRGRISLKSNDAFAYPVIWSNYLSDEDDVRLLVKAINIVLTLTKTKALRAYDMTMSTAPLEACSDHEFLTDEYWACVSHQVTRPAYHQVGTCKMGPYWDPMAVVDPRLRVYGIEGLRVADASIMPEVISANTAAPSMMIGERAADFIKEDWRSRC